MNIDTFNQKPKCPKIVNNSNLIRPQIWGQQILIPPSQPHLKQYYSINQNIPTNNQQKLTEMLKIQISIAKMITFGDFIDTTMSSIFDRYVVVI